MIFETVRCRKVKGSPKYWNDERSRDLWNNGMEEGGQRMTKAIRWGEKVKGSLTNESKKGKAISEQRDEERGSLDLWTMRFTKKVNGSLKQWDEDRKSRDIWNNEMKNGHWISEATRWRKIKDFFLFFVWNMRGKKVKRSLTRDKERGSGDLWNNKNNGMKEAQRISETKTQRKRV